MQLRRLAALERRKLQEEYAELQTRIAELQAILDDPSKVRGIVKEELLDIRRASPTPAGPRSAPTRASCRSRT